MQIGGMEIWLAIALITCIIATLLLKPYISLKNKNSLKNSLPPGPRSIPIISSIKWLRKSTIEVEAALKALHPKYGPIITVSAASRPFIFISTPPLVYEALIQKGNTFASRPNALLTAKILTNNQLNISSANYGPNWRILRRNLISNIVNPSLTKDFSHARKWALNILLKRFKSDVINTEVTEHLSFSVFALLVFMCFGDKLIESEIKDISVIQHKLLTSFGRFQILNMYPPMTKILLRSRWNELFNLKRKRKEILSPYVRSRKEFQKQKILSSSYFDKTTRMVTSYVDTLFELEITDEDHTKRKLNEEELVTLCSEFLNAGTDTTSTALQWIMANLVKYPSIQDTLFQAIKEVIGTEAKEVKEEDLSKIPYLNAVILEGLRRHPPSYFSLPHAVSEEATLGEYNVPKNAIIFFTLTEMCRDPKVWEDPMEFKPERFLENEKDIDITGSREIKMMPFGVGRRICPAFRLAILHLEYFVANLVWKFEWNIPNGYQVDLSEKQEFTVVLKHPLHVYLRPRQFN
ncbi:cytochrome P450 89A2-like [Silene latifolia]|uniref:cytochrome P450 89A2-like n=1 Tax=Silene latifolia TaxID=37657 RepID=UPI003D77C553